MNSVVPVGKNEIKNFMRIFVDKDEVNTYFEVMNKRWGYHNIEHVIFLLSLLREIPDSIPDNFTQLILAILYHDYYYDITSKSNERLSAEMLASDCKIDDLIGEPKKMVIGAQSLIIKSANPRIHSDKGCFVENWSDVLLMHDLDYSILGVGRPHYIEYMVKVASEYVKKDGYTIEQYIKGRIVFLDSLLGKENIFYLEWFKPLEDMVVKNILFEKNLLQSK